MATPYPAGYFGKQPESRAARSVNLTELGRYKKHIVRFIRELPENARVLDVGCGSGKTIRLMKTLRPDLIIEGCDISPVGGYLPSDVPFTCCSVEEIHTKYAENHFDGIICQHVIEHLGSPLGLIQSIRHALKSGGKLFIETPNWTRLFTPFAHFFFWNDYTHVRIYPKFALVKLLQEHSFSSERIVTCATSEWFPRRRAAGIPKESAEAEQTPYTRNSVVSRIAARLVNPLVRDVIIVMARSDKKP